MSEDESTLSLSMMDVLTCGMGGVLVLFFILMALQDGVGQGSNTPTSPAAGNAERAPWVVVVESSVDLPVSEDGSGLWRIEGSGWNLRYAETAARHALLFADRPPPEGVRLAFGPLAAEIRPTVRIFVGGRDRLETAGGVRRPVLRGPDGSLLLWPLPAGFADDDRPGTEPSR